MLHKQGVWKHSEMSFWFHLGSWISQIKKFQVDWHYVLGYQGLPVCLLLHPYIFLETQMITMAQPFPSGLKKIDAVRAAMGFLRYMGGAWYKSALFSFPQQ